MIAIFTPGKQFPYIFFYLFFRPPFYPNFKFNFAKLNVLYFYKHLLLVWCKYSKSPPTTSSAILSEPICFNSFLKIDNKVIYPNFLETGNLFLGDLFSINGSILPWNKFQVKYALPNHTYFKWRQIIEAIPNNWTTSIKIDGGSSRIFMFREPHMLYKARIMPLDKLSAKELYNIIILSKQCAPTSQNYILRLLSLETLPWKQVYSLIRSTTPDLFSRIFQFKCLNNILYLNRSLFKIGIVESPLCSYCNGCNETYVHIFF